MSGNRTSCCFCWTAAAEAAGDHNALMLKAPDKQIESVSPPKLRKTGAATAFKCIDWELVFIAFVLKFNVSKDPSGVMTEWMTHLLCKKTKDKVTERWGSLRGGVMCISPWLEWDMEYCDKNTVCGSRPLGCQDSSVVDMVYIIMPWWFCKYKLS